MKKGSGFKSLAFVAAALGFMAGTSASAFIPANNSVNVRIKDAVKDKTGQVSQSESRKGYSGQSPFVHHRKFSRNQRQKRAWLRSVPHLRNSKKCCIK